ncbi:phosphate signaling complex protein PhoU [Desulfotalea psychrophila]|uniref:Phosphate-specific transport system accessory protein PhoU n=1 Tax=Desulfotalea psychrophila (strain LSv54 / DSM 12343) TaxID=177439 RepID=Q6AM12_DESPS|nr:phosphate signaling complex protein PhoU [Desulfotalea psychrophila]CAG36613.1 related to phosphate transport system regulatory protein PhoU [Desulfotalea psychrophila LSv54]
MVLQDSFQNELIALNCKMMHMSSLVENRVQRATEVIESHNEEAVNSLIRSDYEIDELEVEIEEDCLKLLALYQPVASDLRFIVAVIKINNEMERIADTAVNIGRCVRKISEQQIEVGQTIDYSTMSRIVIEMLKMSIDALVKRDSAKARQVFFLDDDVDALRDSAYKNIKAEFYQGHDCSSALIDVFLVAGYLERIADRATNIAEEVVYLVEGDIVRIS